MRRCRNLFPSFYVMRYAATFIALVAALCIPSLLGQSAPPRLIAPGQVSTCTVGVVVYAPPCTWRLSVRFDSMSAFDRIREWGSRLFSTYGMPTLADRLWPGKYFAIVSGPQVEQQ